MLLQEILLKSAWGMLENETKTDLESQLNCCGLLNGNASHAQYEEDLANCPAVSFRYQIFHHYVHQERKTLYFLIENLLEHHGHRLELLCNETLFCFIQVIWSSLYKLFNCSLASQINIAVSVYFQLHNMSH